MPPIDIEVLLPVHNEAASIEGTVRAMYAELSKVARTGFIICEDGSRDNSREVLRGLAAGLPMRLNMSAARKGYSRAMREGMAMTEADFLLCLDSDGQCDPRDFASFWEARGDADVIFGWRMQRADPWLRRTLSRFFLLFYQSAFRVPVHDPSCPFALFRREVAHALAAELGAMNEGFWWEFIARAHRRGYSIVEFPVNHRTRAAGTTQVYAPMKMPGIFLRHLAGIWTIWKQTRVAKET